MGTSGQPQPPATFPNKVALRLRQGDVTRSPTHRGHGLSLKRAQPSHGFLKTRRADSSLHFLLGSAQLVPEGGPKPGGGGATHAQRGTEEPGRRAGLSDWKQDAGECGELGTPRLRSFGLLGSRHTGIRVYTD